jgi:hypothetical protein
MNACGYELLRSSGSSHKSGPCNLWPGTMVILLEQGTHVFLVTFASRFDCAYAAA